MKHPLLRFLSCGLATLALGSIGAHATLAGFNNDPGDIYWNRGDANTGYSVFDLYRTWQFNQEAANLNYGITGSVWSQTQAFGSGGAGGGLYIRQTNIAAPLNNGSTNPGINGDVLFGGGNAVTFVLEGTVSFTLRGIVLQVKRPGNGGTLADANGFLPVLTINGGAAIPFDTAALSTMVTGDSSSSNGNSFVTSYYWNASLAGLPDVGTSTYAITADNASLQRGVDGIELDVANVPEPASTGLLACGLGVVVLLRRRRTVA